MAGNKPGPDGKKRGDLFKCQIIFRIWNDQRDKLALKMQMDDTSIQRLMEVLVTEYLNDNPEVVKIVQEKAAFGIGRTKVNMKRDYYFDDTDTKLIMERLENESPLQDIAVTMEEK